MLTKNLFAFLFLVSHLISLVSSYSSLPMGSNSSTSQLQARQPKRHYIPLSSGSRVLIRQSDRPTSIPRTCTFGFAVKKVRGPGKGRFAHGYLTSAGCKPSRSNVFSNVFVQISNNRGEIEEVVVGKTLRGSGTYDPKRGLDYVAVEVFPDF
jgi:hypothetical protein